MPRTTLSSVRLRHRTVAAGAALLVAGALAGCSGSASASASASATATASAEGNTVSTLYGDVTVPAGVHNVVAIGFPEATALVDLGITPIGRPSYIPALPAYDDALGDVPVVEDADGNPDLEKIAALKPDLIIGSEFVDQLDQTEYQQLSSIAPTVILEWQKAAGNWQAEAEGTAQAVGAQDALAKLKQDYKDRTDQIKSQYADVLANNTVDLISGDANNWFLYSAGSSHGRVLVDAGARLNAAADQTEGFVQYSPERYDLLKDTDLLVVSGVEATPPTEITSNAVFASTKAAQAGHVVATTYFFSSSYQIAQALLDDFESALQSLQG